MVTGSLHATFRFKVSFVVIITLISFITAFSLQTKPALAANWFAVYGAGVLSGYNADGPSIINTGIPASGIGTYPDVIWPNTIQTGNDTEQVESKSGFLLGSNDLNVNRGGSSTQDPFAKFTGSDYTNLAILPAGEKTFADLVREGVTLYQPNCTTFLTGGPAPVLGSGPTYEVSVVSVRCLKTALGNVHFNGGDTYKLNGDGLAVILVKTDTENTIPINYPLSAGAGVDKRRILIITDAKILVDPAVTSAISGIGSTPAIQAAFVTTDPSEDAFKVSTGTNPLTIEGPIVAGGNITLSRSPAGDALGVLVKYNPLYMSELSKVGFMGFNIHNFSDSKVTWRYE